MTQGPSTAPVVQLAPLGMSRARVTPLLWEAAWNTGSINKGALP